ncbi:MAG: tRNA dihydrouridine(20/20a) synthase DusA, partial [Pseudomonadota bacterium]
NLNVGCPSDRVQSGTFGAVLMKTPEVVADCVSKMAAVSSAPVTVKCRIGVDDQNPAEVLPHFLSTMRSAGVRHVIVHARKAWLKGLSPKENREIPPLDYPLVQSMLAAFPDMHIAINGGLGNLTEAQQFLDAGFCGVMIGRAAYHTPYDILGPADAALWASAHHVSRAEVIAAMEPYIAAHLQSGGTLHQVTRHMLGLFAGQPGARAWRRILSEGATRPGAGLEVLQAAYDAVSAASSIAHPNAAE